MSTVLNFSKARPFYTSPSYMERPTLVRRPFLNENGTHQTRHSLFPSIV